MFFFKVIINIFYVMKCLCFSIIVCKVNLVFFLILIIKMEGYFGGGEDKRFKEVIIILFLKDIYFLNFRNGKEI